MERKEFSFRARLKSFCYAFDGLMTLIKTEHNARIHLCAAVCGIVAGCVFGISVAEWMAVAFAAGFVFAMEAVNSAVEYLADFVSPDKHELIRNAKDVAAAAVLIAAITAVIIGGLVFVPKILAFCEIC